MCLDLPHHEMIQIFLETYFHSPPQKPHHLISLLVHSMYFLGVLTIYSSRKIFISSVMHLQQRTQIVMASQT